MPDFGTGASTTIFKPILGKTIVDVNKTDDSLFFTTLCGMKFVMRHDQDCCEHVYIVDINGDLGDLLNHPVLVAEARYSDDAAPSADPLENAYGHDVDSWTWTFIELATIKGSVTVRWFGSSNGYYSETADLYEIKHDRFRCH